MSTPKLVVVGSYNQDLIFNTASLPAPGETCLASMHTAHGGKGFNQAVAAARMGATTHFIGALGDDAAASSMAQFAHDNSIELQRITVDAPTGCAAVVVDADGENQIVVAAGANMQLTVEQLLPHHELISNAQVLLCQMESPVTVTSHALRLCSGWRILNPAPMPKAIDVDLLHHCDIITPNEGEFRSLCAQLNLPELEELGPDIEMDVFDQIPTPTVLVTMGKRGCLSYTRDTRFASQPTLQLIPADAVEAVDTTGAGDAFNGAFGAQLIRTKGDLLKSIELAMRAAAIAVTRPGAAPAMAYAHEL